MRFFNLSSAMRLLAVSVIAFNGVAAESDGFFFPVLLTSLVKHIPADPSRTLTGSQFATYVAKMDSRQREQAILSEILAGNMPAFLRNLVPVELKYQPSAGKILTATVFVMPEYLAIGTDQDYLRIPMNLLTAAAVATKLGFVLPTRKIVDAIYRQAAFHLSPEPMTPGPQMGSTEYYKIHNQKIEAQSHSLGVTHGSLVSGNKKDVVMTSRLESNPGRIAIYGWHRLTGAPIQPLSTVHGSCYADYSHGIRLVSETAIVEGQPRSIYDVLQDSSLAGILSDEGPMLHLREFITRTAEEKSCPSF